MRSNWRIIPAVPTFFDSKLKVNREALFMQIDTMFKEGAEACLILGTTGEANSLSFEERTEIIKNLASQNFDKEKIFIGTGCTNYEDTIKLTNTAIEEGFENVLILPPFYYKGISEKGLIDYFKQVLPELSDSSKVYFYHIPAMTGVEFTPDVIEALTTAFPGRIAGIKDSSGVLENTLKLANQFPQLKIYTGNEKGFLRCMNKGLAGIISATFNIQIDLAKWTLNAYEQKRDSMFHLEKQLISYRELIEKLPLISAVKYMLSLKYDDISLSNLRPPLVPLNEEERKTAVKIFERLITE